MPAPFFLPSQLMEHKVFTIIGASPTPSLSSDALPLQFLRFRDTGTSARSCCRHSTESNCSIDNNNKKTFSDCSRGQIERNLIFHNLFFTSFLLMLDVFLFYLWNCYFQHYDNKFSIFFFFAVSARFPFCSHK